MSDNKDSKEQRNDAQAREVLTLLWPVNRVICEVIMRLNFLLSCFDEDGKQSLGDEVDDDAKEELPIFPTEKASMQEALQSATTDFLYNLSRCNSKNFWKYCGAGKMPVMDEDDSEKAAVRYHDFCAAPFKLTLNYFQTRYEHELAPRFLQWDAGQPKLMDEYLRRIFNRFLFREDHARLTVKDFDEIRSKFSQITSIVNELSCCKPQEREAHIKRLHAVMDGYFELPAVAKEAEEAKEYSRRPEERGPNFILVEKKS